MKRAVIVQGLGFGDEGKGATVDFLARELSADWVVRYCGGSQAGHNVVLPDGRRHTFSQFGSGTFAGAATYLGGHMIINPPAMRNEARHLKELTGNDPFDRLLVHPRALVSTWYHQQLNRLRELSRGGGRHGSCGHGIGETRSYWLKYGSDALMAGDLNDREVAVGKVELVRQRVLLEAQEVAERVPADERWRMNNLMMPARQIADELTGLGDSIAVQLHLPEYQTALFEGAQGVLLDEWRGFHPYTTWSTVTPHHALEMIAESQADEVCTLGLTRAYATRHGAGPLPTWSQELDRRLHDLGNPTNAWQGTIRNGWLDLVLLRYAAIAFGSRMDGLVINNLDELSGIDVRVCSSYTCAGGNAIDRLPISPILSLAAQERLTALLEQAVSNYEPVTIEALCAMAADQIAPIAITGRGPTWQQRTLHGLSFQPTGSSAIKGSTISMRLCRAAHSESVV